MGHLLHDWAQHTYDYWVCIHRHRLMRAHWSLMYFTFYFESKYGLFEGEVCCELPLTIYFFVLMTEPRVFTWEVTSKSTHNNREVEKGKKPKGLILLVTLVVVEYTLSVCVCVRCVVYQVPVAGCIKQRMVNGNGVTMSWMKKVKRAKQLLLLWGWDDTSSFSRVCTINTHCCFTVHVCSFNQHYALNCHVCAIACLTVVSPLSLPYVCYVLSDGEGAAGEAC